MAESAAAEAGAAAFALTAYVSAVDNFPKSEKLMPPVLRDEESDGADGCGAAPMSAAGAATGATAAFR